MADIKEGKCLTLYLKPSSGTMSTSKMYLAHGMRPERLILQCGNILLQQRGESMSVWNKINALKIFVSAVLPARFGDDHLCSYFMESLPEFRVLQSHPDAALEVGVGAGSHGGGRRAAEVGLQVWK